MTKIIVYHSNGTETVFENVVDWAVWTSEDVEDVAKNRGVTIKDEDKEKLYVSVSHDCFHLDHCCDYEEFADIVDDCLTDLGYELNKTEEEMD